MILSLTACNPPVASTPERRPAPTAPTASPAPTTAPTSTAAITPTPRAKPPSAAPCAHTLDQRAPRDARSAEALTHCHFEPSGHDDIGDRCGSTPHTVSVERLNEAVMPLSPAAQQKLRAQWQKGQRAGLNPRAFALIGDSITASPKFITPLVQPGSSMSDAVATQLSLDGATIVDHYRGASVVAGLDSFVAPRAARVGAPSGWATPAGISPAASPVGQLIKSHAPAIALLMYGSNDATARFVELDDLVAGYEARMSRIIDQLEAAGVVVVLHTVPRHMLDPGRPLCDKNPGDLSNWRLAVQTSALSAAAAQLACQRHLPLIDLRHAFDALLNHGIGPDGVHPNAHRESAGRLDDEGLRCGYNVRNYVTLRMLREIHAALHRPAE